MLWLQWGCFPEGIQWVLENENLNAQQHLVLQSFPILTSLPIFLEVTF